MKTKSIFIIISLFLIISNYSCTKDDNNTDPSNTETYMKVKINGENWESNDVVASYSPSTKTLFIVALDTDGNNGLELKIINYNGTGTYNIDENIIVQRITQAYFNPGGNAGSIKITKDNGIIYEGEFDCTLVNILDQNDVLELKNGDFKARTN